ncbi:MAG: DUF2203 domain-containing protein [bacterium]
MHTHFHHFFSLEEANALIPKLREIIPQLQKLWHRMEHIEEHRKRKFRAQFTGGEQIPPEYFLSFIQFHKIMRELEDGGMILRDLRHGVVDFPHLRKGSIVFLCWKLGEEQIYYWHEKEKGFAGRRPVEEL